MFTTPANTTTATTAAVETTPAARNRLIALIALIGVAVALMFTPALATAAHATTAKKPSASHIAAGWARTMLGTLNKERAAHNLKALTMNTDLIKSAHAHNADMAKQNTMSHQLPGEAFFANRITKAGYKWNFAGENIGWNSQTTTTALLSLEVQMYNEVAPNNGHRLNILSKNFTEVGIDVYWDTHNHKMWFTQDFGHQA
jgi:uncharacterized protein YkwD